MAHGEAAAAPAALQAGAYAPCGPATHCTAGTGQPIGAAGHAEGGEAAGSTPRAAGAPPAPSSAPATAPAPAAAPAAGNLERFRVRGAPPHDLGDLYLLPDYVSPKEEARLMHTIASQRAAWVQVRGAPSALHARWRHDRA